MNLNLGCFQSHWSPVYGLIFLRVRKIVVQIAIETVSGNVAAKHMSCLAWHIHCALGCLRVNAGHEIIYYSKNSQIHVFSWFVSSVFIHLFLSWLISSLDLEISRGYCLCVHWLIAYRSHRLLQKAYQPNRDLFSFEWNNKGNQFDGLLFSKEHCTYSQNQLGARLFQGYFFQMVAY